MSQAFYPTKDGHLGNIKKLPLPKLLELIRRQENLLKKKAFLNSLPDKGSKIPQHLSILNKELKLRKQNDNKFLMKGTEQHVTVETEHYSTAKYTDKTLSILKKESIVNNTGSETVSTTNKLNVTPGLNSEINAEHAIECDTSLEESLQRLSVGDDITDRTNNEAKVKHYYELAEDSALRNAGELKKQSKLNSSLNITSVKDLPDDFLKLKPPVNKQTTQFVRDLAEESAVVPPTYKYSEVTMVSLTESLHLQETQKLKQEELQASSAAEKLFQRLNIKMEKYNPEGVAMSYRNTQDGYNAEPDSDDDSDDSPAINIVHSDSED